MSEDFKSPVDAQEDASSTNEKEAYVPKNAYEGVKNDMFKYKSKVKDMEAELNKLRADKEAADRERMEEEGRWKELAETYKSKASEIENKYSESQKKFIDFHKKQSVISKLGGLKKDDYAAFIKTDSIETDENGQINMDSVLAEVNRLRESYPEIIKGEKVESFNRSPAKTGGVAEPKKELRTEKDFMEEISKSFFKR